VRRLIPALAAAMLLAAALASPAAAISYGQVDTAGEYPSTGALIEQFSSGKWVVCSGTLVSTSVFLTAAHCVDEGQAVWVSFDLHINEPVTAQTNTIYSGTAHHPADSYCRGCGESDPLDVAVVVLDDGVQGVIPAELPTLNLLSEMSNRDLKSATFRGRRLRHRSRRQAEGRPIAVLGSDSAVRVADRELPRAGLAQPEHERVDR
jgi:hypothetical protein